MNTKGDYTGFLSPYFLPVDRHDQQSHAPTTMPPQPQWTLPSQKHIQECIAKFNILETFSNIFSKRLSILSFTLSVNPFEVISMNDIGRNPGFLMVCYACKLGSLPSCCCFSNTSSKKRQENHSSQKLFPKNKIHYIFEDFIHDILIIFLSLLPNSSHIHPTQFHTHFARCLVTETRKVTDGVTQNFLLSSSSIFPPVSVELSTREHILVHTERLEQNEPQAKHAAGIYFPLPLYKCVFSS